MKQIIAIIILSTFSFSGQAQLQSMVIDKIIARVGGEYILLSDVEKQFSYLQQTQKDLEESAKCGVLESIIAQKLMVNQAKLDSIIVGDTEVEASLDFRIQSILSQMGDNEEFFEDYYGQTVNEVKEWMRDDLRNQLLSERMQSSIIDQVLIRPEEVVEFFESIPKDSLPLLNAEVEIAEIVMKPEASQASKDKSYELLLNIRNQITNDSADFAELAKKYSDDLGSGAKGGELGSAKRGSYVPEFEAAAYSLANGEISEIVESDFGYHLIQLNERRGNVIDARHILIKPEVTTADNDKTKNFLDSLRAVIESDSLDFGKMVKKHSDKNVESYSNNGRMTNPASGTTFFSTNDLPPEIYFGIENLDINDISNPIEYQDNGGELRYRIVQLQTETRPHIANLKEDYSKLQKFAIESKKNDYFNDWIVSKLSDTYITVDDKYSTCANIGDWIKAGAQ